MANLKKFLTQTELTEFKSTLDKVDETAKNTGILYAQLNAFKAETLKKEQALKDANNEYLQSLNAKDLLIGELRNKYGEVDINLLTGEITENTIISAADLEPQEDNFKDDTPTGTGLTDPNQ